MAAYSDIISTLGGATSNSYVSGLMLMPFASFQSWSAAWLAKTEESAPLPDQCLPVARDR